MFKIKATIHRNTAITLMKEKFFNSNKKIQEKYIQYAMENCSLDYTFDILDEKKQFLNTNDNEKFGTGDKVNVPFLFVEDHCKYYYDHLNMNWYIENELTENLGYLKGNLPAETIKLKIHSIDPISSKVGLIIVTKENNITIESVIYVSQYEIPNQIELELVI
jgi:hypothetical protein